MKKANILYICGSLNQTRMMHKISMHLDDYNNYFTPYYADGYLRKLANQGILDFTILGGKFKQRTINYLASNNLKFDYEGKDRDYQLVFTCSDLIVPSNIKKKRVILIQEGMTDPEGIAYFLVKKGKFPRWIASTSVTGLSDCYDKFCVASEGYRQLFIKKGVNPNKIVVTGIPNHDNYAEFSLNNFPYKQYVLAATSDARETFKYENRKKFINHVMEIAGGRQIIFKLHPNENEKRAVNEINKYAPGALVFTDTNIEEMVANCDVLVTKYSTVVYAGIALGKEVHSYFDLETLKKLLPIQNNGESAQNISQIAKELLSSSSVPEKAEAGEVRLSKRLLLKLKPYGRPVKIG